MSVIYADSEQDFLGNAFYAHKYWAKRPEHREMEEGVSEGLTPLNPLEDVAHIRPPCNDLPFSSTNICLSFVS